jgi:hypothetical protein
MRRAYGWTRALLTAIVAVGAVALGIRALLTALFVALVTAKLPLVALFNVCVSLLVGRLLLASGAVRVLSGRFGRSGRAPRRSRGRSRSVCRYSSAVVRRLSLVARRRSLVSRRSWSSRSDRL